MKKIKCGLEIHQQLDSHKLFCNCPSVLRSDEPEFEVGRRLHAVAGESGEVDIAAKFEAGKGREFVYQGYDTTCLVELDEEAVKLALVNLLDNAIKFSKDDKRIILTLKKQEKTAVVSVRDFGIGIPESEHKKIFDKFYRIEGSLVHNTKGSGLGLSLVKHIMEIHKGKVVLKSKPGEGSMFSLVFPVV